MKLAHFSPLPPLRSGVADYCAQLLPALAEHAEVDAYAPLQDGALHALPITDFPGRRGEYDAYLYHMGNQPAYHQEIYEALCRYPGVVVLHDVNLHAFFLNQPDPWAYVQAIGYERGLEGVMAARQIRAGRQPAPVTTQALAKRLADLSLGLIVHSQFAARSLSAVTRTPVVHISQGFAAPPLEIPEPPALLAGLPDGTRILASFGFIAPSKRLDVILRTLAHVRHEIPPFRYLLVGEPVAGYDVEAPVHEYGLQEVVLTTGYVDQLAFARYLAHTDVGVSLRTAPTGGETSSALLHMMACGLPVIVSDVGAFAEFPEETVLKIPQDERETEQLASALKQLLADAGLCQQLGEQARRYVQKNHSFDRVASQLLSFVQACMGGTRAVSSSPVKFA